MTCGRLPTSGCLHRDIGIGNPSLELSWSEIRSGPGRILFRVSDDPNLGISETRILVGKNTSGPDLFRSRFFGAVPRMRQTARGRGGYNPPPPPKAERTTPGRG